jgi:predicted dehydrogenase
LFGKPRRVTGFLRHESTIDDSLADSTLAILEHERGMSEIRISAFQPHGDQYREVEILGTNGRAVAKPFSPLRLMVDLGKAAGPYKAGVQQIEPPAAAGPTFAPDFLEMAKVIRGGAAPTKWPK